MFIVKLLLLLQTENQEDHKTPIMEFSRYLAITPTLDGKCNIKVKKKEKIRYQYNQIPHIT